MAKNKGRIIVIAVVVFLAACGLQSAEDYIEQNYTFVDAVQNQANSSERAFLYRTDKNLAATAEELANIEQPQQIGEKVEGRQVLVYDDEFIILTEDPDNAGSTLVEVAEEEFVRTHYHPGFFSGMLLGSLLSTRFGSGWNDTQLGRCRGGGCYSGGGSYRSIPGSSLGRGSTFRGGGPGTGK